MNKDEQIKHLKEQLKESKNDVVEMHNDFKNLYEEVSRIQDTSSFKATQRLQACLTVARTWFSAF